MSESETIGNPFSALQRVFHEPNRLAIMSALVGTVDGLTFRGLKEQCDLTDGNLNRHLKTLEDSGAVRIKKRFVGARPQTTVVLTTQGREGFMHYLNALETVLQRAAEAMNTEESRVPWAPPLQDPV